MRAMVSEMRSGDCQAAYRECWTWRTRRLRDCGCTAIGICRLHCENRIRVTLSTQKGVRISCDGMRRQQADRARCKSVQEYDKHPTQARSPVTQLWMASQRRNSNEPVSMMRLRIVRIATTCYKCGELPKKPESPSPLVIAADQLAQAAEKAQETGCDKCGDARCMAIKKLRTALANYKRVREG
jgi:hypothetical protein